MNNSIPLEIERKYLIHYPEVAWLARQPDSRFAELTQIYLQPDGISSRRVRSWTEGGKTLLYYTAKRQLTDMTREEREREITEEEYSALLLEADPSRRPIRKIRWCIPYEEHVLEIDLYPFWTRQAVLECELRSENESFSIPPEIHVIREVTGDVRYQNSRLALKIPDEDL